MMQTKRTYHLRRTDAGPQQAWPLLAALAGVIALATLMIGLLLCGLDRKLACLAAAAIAGAAAAAAAWLILRLQQHGMTVEVERLDGVEEADAAEAATEETETSAESAETETQADEPGPPSWYDMPYPDPDAEEAPAPDEPDETPDQADLPQSEGDQPALESPQRQGDDA